MKAIAYIRVSTDDQSNSIDAQRRNIESYCKFKDITIVETFIDENISGYTEIGQRPSGLRMIDFLSKHDVRDVISVKPDRLFRNTLNALTIISDWNEQGINLHLVDVGGTSVNTKTAIGKMLFTQIVSFAEFERNITAERTKTVLLNKKNKREAYAPCIYGFNNNNGKLDVVLEEMNIVKYIYENKNKKLSFIARELNNNKCKTKKGGKFYASTIKYILNNEIYTEYINNQK